MQLLRNSGIPAGCGHRVCACVRVVFFHTFSDAPCTTTIIGIYVIQCHQTPCVPWEAPRTAPGGRKLGCNGWPDPICPSPCCRCRRTLLIGSIASSWRVVNRSGLLTGALRHKGTVNSHAHPCILGISYDLLQTAWSKLSRPMCLLLCAHALFLRSDVQHGHPCARGGRLPRRGVRESDSGAVARE